MAPAAGALLFWEDFHFLIGTQYNGSENMRKTYEQPEDVLRASAVEA